MRKPNPAAWATASPGRAIGAVVALVLFVLFAAGSCTVIVFGGNGDVPADSSTAAPRDGRDGRDGRDVVPPAGPTTLPGVPHAPENGLPPAPEYTPPTLPDGVPEPPITPKDDREPVEAEASPADVEACKKVATTVAAAAATRPGEDRDAWEERMRAVLPSNAAATLAYDTSLEFGRLPTGKPAGVDVEAQPGACDARVAFADGAVIGVSADTSTGEWAPTGWAVERPPTNAPKPTSKPIPGVTAPPIPGVGR